MVSPTMQKQVPSTAKTKVQIPTSSLGVAFPKKVREKLYYRREKADYIIKKAENPLADSLLS